MKKILLVAALWLSASAAFAQAPQTVRLCNGSQPNCPLISGSNPLPVTGALTTFAPATTGTPISVTTGGVSGNLPAGAVVVATNVGSTNPAYCKLGASATTSDQYIAPSGGWFAYTVGAATQLTCITGSSTTTVNMVGGSGLPTGTGGGSGGGGGGGGAVTMASAAVASGAYSSGSIASGAYAAGSLATGAAVDGWDITQGAKADSVCATDTGTCSLIALLKKLTTNVASAIPSGANVIGRIYAYFGPAQLSSASLDFSSSGNNTAVARSVGTIKVYGLSISCASALTTVQLQNGAATAVGKFYNITSMSLGVGNSGGGGEPLWTTTGTNNFVINLSSGVACGGTVWYIDS